MIENDFGEARIDASLLEKYDPKVNSLTEGCICSSLAGDLKKNSGNATVQLCSRSAADRTFRCRKTFRHIKIMFSLEDRGKLQLQQTITTVDVRFLINTEKLRRNL